MAKIKLQNNFTTPEQSKRLLELGVPANSADCYWNTICNKPIPMQYGILYSDKRNQFAKENVPSWSVGRLIEIYLNCVCNPLQLVTLTDEDNPIIDKLMNLFEENTEKYIDFSKLEE